MRLKNNMLNLKSENVKLDYMVNDDLNNTKKLFLKILFERGVVAVSKEGFFFYGDK